MMAPKYYYLLVDLACLSVPLLFSFHPALKFWKNASAFFAATVAMMLVFIPWDIYFTGIGVWGFNPEYITGFKLSNLPVEEYLFFICIPYACLFTYNAIQIWFKKRPVPQWPRIVAWLMLGSCVLMAFFYFDKKYTLFTHLMCAGILFLHLVVWKTKYLPIFIITFLVILLPFFLSNGILTGLDFWKYPFLNTAPGLIDEKIVWYNNEENTGIRMFSIPVEDVSYGMAMLLLVTTVYEYLLGKFTAKNMETSNV